mmetsp:Transcript_25907/g.61812  ORF Transcript_25907/g.61812 Transcript_25907/m.61812 type:complete len:236 (+) Transcript_25907:101-808(+)
MHVKVDDRDATDDFRMRFQRVHRAAEDVVEDAESAGDAVLDQPVPPRVMPRRADAAERGPRLSERYCVHRVADSSHGTQRRVERSLGEEGVAFPLLPPHPWLGLGGDSVTYTRRERYRALRLLNLAFEAANKLNVLLRVHPFHLLEGSLLEFLRDVHLPLLELVSAARGAKLLQNLLHSLRRLLVALLGHVIQTVRVVKHHNARLGRNGQDSLARCPPVAKVDALGDERPRALPR